MAFTHQPYGPGPWEIALALKERSLGLAPAATINISSLHEDGHCTPMFRRSSPALRGLPKISYAEFYDAFIQQFRLAEYKTRQRKGARIGIAVSGGVDSMALAQLCSGLAQHPPAKQQWDFQFKAYIIDHNAREGSVFEAQLVRDRIFFMGLYPLIIRLTWPPGVKPLDLPDFETQARTLRYRALGTACRDSRIDTLLLGHHQDDQAETVLMRLAYGQRDNGLRGMQAHGNIPECWGVHGVHESGKLESVASRLERLESQGQNLPLTPHAESQRRMLSSDQTFEGGGVRVIRPLLAFSKDRLVETCRAHSVRWIEDETNKDTWRTPRNAIRELLQTSRLPKALRKESTLRLARCKADVFAKSISTSSKLFANCDILLFDVRSGGLVVRLLKWTMSTDVSQQPMENYLKKARITAALLLRQMVNIVSPQDETSVQSLKHAVLSIFPDLRDLKDDSNRKHQPTGLTAGAVRFQRLAWPLSQQRPRSGHSSFKEPRPELNELDPDYVWKLTRQPYSGDLPTLTISPCVSDSHTLIASDAAPPQTYPMSNASPWSPWQLWDGRYWIRVLNCSSHALIVRPLQASDLQSIAATISRDRWKTFCRFLASTAPEKVRWTLPTISKCPDDRQKLGKVLVLPTLGRDGILDIYDENGNRKVDWEVRYKRVSLGYLFDNDNNIIHRNRDVVTTWND